MHSRHVPGGNSIEFETIELHGAQVKAILNIVLIGESRKGGSEMFSRKLCIYFSAFIDLTLSQLMPTDALIMPILHSADRLAVAESVPRMAAQTFTTIRSGQIM